MFTLFSSLFQASSASATTWRKSQPGISFFRFSWAFSALTADMPVFTINGLVTSAAVISHLPVPNDFTVTGCENSAKKNAFWSLAQPLEKRWPARVVEVILSTL